MISTLHRLEFTEQELCERIGCVYQTLRSYLDGYKFAKVEKIKVWHYKDPTLKGKHKRKSLTYKYILSDVELLQLLRLRKRHRY